MGKIKWICLLLCMALLVTACGSRSDSPPELVIASANPMTGNSSAFGDMKVKAMQLAVEEINSRGGINGRKLRLLVGDDASSPREAFALAQKLAADGSLLAIVGHWNSACTLAARNVYNGAGIPVITDSVNKAITDGTTPYLFRISLTDTSQAMQLARYAYDKLKYRKAAVIYTNNDFGKGLREDFREAFQAMGGEVVAMETFFEGQTRDFTAELLKIKNAGADFVFIAGYYVETALIARQNRELGITLPLLGTEGTSSPELVGLGGRDVEGIRFVGFFHPDLPQNNGLAFVAAFRAKYGKDPDTYAAMAYDSVLLLVEAMRKAAPERSAVYRYLGEVKNYPGVTGNIGFNAKHDAQSRIIILTVKNGAIVPDAIQP